LIVFFTLPRELRTIIVNYFTDQSKQFLSVFLTRWIQHKIGSSLVIEFNLK